MLLHERTWFAAAIDGEGTITINRNRTTYCARVGIYNKDRSFCERAFELCPFGGVSGSEERQFVWQTTRKDIVLQLLKEIYPHLIIKKANAKLVIDWIENGGDPPLNFSGKSIDNEDHKHHLKGNRGRSAQHRKAALSAKHHDRKGNRVKGHHAKAAKARWQKQKQINKL